MSWIERQARCVLLDIEGTVSDVRFVYDVMFPYAKREMASYVTNHWSDRAVRDAVMRVATDAKHQNIEDWLGPDWQSENAACQRLLIDHLHDLMSRDSKDTGLKQLQGLVWQKGFQSGEIKSELFPDVLPALKVWKDSGLDLRIFSSGSVLAQKLFFEFTTSGNILHFFRAHYDTTIGSKKEASSYQRIVEDVGINASSMLFVTDVYQEIIAAEQAGLQVVASIRPNNASLPAEFHGASVTDFSQLHIVPS